MKIFFFFPILLLAAVVVFVEVVDVGFSQTPVLKIKHHDAIEQNIRYIGFLDPVPSLRRATPPACAISPIEPRRATCHSSPSC